MLEHMIIYFCWNLLDADIVELIATWSVEVGYLLVNVKHLWPKDDRQSV